MKTRLAPLLGAAGAARLQARMAEYALGTAAAAGFDALELHATGRAGHPFFERMRRRHGLRLRRQSRGDIGRRMRSAFERALRSYPCVVLIGSDCPSLRPADLRAAARALREGADAVFAPAEDGGYALIGLRRVRAALFGGVAWGSGRVMQQTRARLRALGWRWRELRTVWDVDRPEDVARLRAAGLLRRAARRLTSA